MKNEFTIGLIAVAVSALSYATPALADHEDQARADAHDAHHEAHQAAHQEEKAQRDAAHGDIAGAEHHAEKANEASHDAHHDAHKAKRQAEKAGY